MTAGILPPVDVPVRGRGSPFTGTGLLLRLSLRRDRIVLPAWVLLLSVPLSTVYVASIEAVYGSAAQRQVLADSIMASPAERAMYGMIHNASLGATGLWKAGLLHALIAVAVILTVIRHTRADEETGRTELVVSTGVGRYAGLTAALALGFGASLVTGLVGAVGLLTTDVAPAGSIAFGMALAGSGLVFTGVAAVTAQLSSGARTARGLAFAVLGAAFAIRAVGDAGSGTLSWLSPLGWSLKVRPYAGEHWWVLTLHLTATIVLTGAAYLLLRSRDLGAGLIADRLGPARAGGRLHGVVGLAWRLQRGLLLAWLVGLSLYALLFGAVVTSVAGTVADSPRVVEMISRLGGTRSLEDSFVTTAFTMVAVGAAVYGVSATLRLHTEESLQRAEDTLAGAVGRTRWLISHLAVALVGSAVLLVVAGLVTGVVYGTMSDDLAGRLPEVLGAALVQVPAAWMLSAVTIALFGLVPRYSSLAWGVLGAFVALLLLGASAGVPPWVLDLQPFTQAPKLPGEAFRATPLLWLLLIDAVLIVAGALGLRRRDLRS